MSHKDQKDEGIGVECQVVGEDGIKCNRQAVIRRWYDREDGLFILLCDAHALNDGRNKLSQSEQV